MGVLSFSSAATSEDGAVVAPPPTPVSVRSEDYRSERDPSPCGVLRSVLQDFPGLRRIVYVWPPGFC